MRMLNQRMHGMECLQHQLVVVDYIDTLLQKGKSLTVLHRLVTTTTSLPRNIKFPKSSTPSKVKSEENRRTLLIESTNMGVLAVKRSSLIVMLMVILALMAVNVAAQGQSLTCAVKLISCQNYLNSTNPPEECCKPLNDIVKNDLSCLCDILKNPDILKGFGIDINQALKLPANCGIINASSNLCNSIAVGSPSGSPGHPGEPPTTPGNDNSGASRSTLVGLWGMISLFLI